MTACCSMETPNESKALSEREKQKKKHETNGRSLPPERDEESGKLINPHNPEFITKVPWYLEKVVRLEAPRVKVEC